MPANLETIYEATGYFRDEKGKLYGVRQSDNRLIAVCVSHAEAIATGSLPGHADWFKLGFNGDVGTTEEDVWEVGGTYVPPTAEMGMEIYSSDDTQDKVGGTGILSVQLHYLDIKGINHTTNSLVNGNTPVALTVTDIYRIIDFHGLTFGSDKKAKGNVDLRHLNDTPIYARVAAGYTASRTCFITVPAGKVMYITDVPISSGGTTKQTRFTLKANYILHDESKVDFFLPYKETQCTDSQDPQDMRFPLAFPAGVDIKVSVKGGAVSGLATVAMRGWVLDVC